jgi:hypothetical protein
MDPAADGDGDFRGSLPKGPRGAAYEPTPRFSVDRPQNRTASNARRWHTAYLAATGVPQAPTDLPVHQAIIYEQRLGGATRTFR